MCPYQLPCLRPTDHSQIAAGENPTCACMPGVTLDLCLQDTMWLSAKGVRASNQTLRGSRVAQHWQPGFPLQKLWEDSLEWPPRLLHLDPHQGLSMTQCKGTRWSGTIHVLRGHSPDRDAGAQS